jgi:hypothetical protein
MNGAFLWVILGVLVGVVGTLVVGTLRSRRNAAAPSASGTPIAPSPARAEDGEIAALRQNLRLKVMYDEEKIDRLIQTERERMPNASLRQLMRSAIERWERENR